MTIIPRQDQRAYNQSLLEWLPPQAREAAMRGDTRAGLLVHFWQRYRALRKLEDWAEFVERRKEFEQGRMF